MASSLTPAEFPSTAAVDRSAAGLQYQSYQMDLTASGAALGVARRSTPNASAQFSNPPVSGGQFGGGHAKSMATLADDDDEGGEY